MYICNDFRDSGVITLEFDHNVIPTSLRAFGNGKTDFIYLF